MSRNATPSSEAAESPCRGTGFASTQWSVVLSAAQTDPVAAREALEALCRAYWQPLYGYVRRTGRGREDAEDLVQGFFADFLERKAVEGARRESGRFRGYLLVCLKNFMRNEWNRERRQKRGGSAVHLSLDWGDAEARFRMDSSEELSPDRLFDREWALTLIGRVVNRLRDEAVAQGKEDQFDALKQCLTLGRGEIPYETIASRTGMTPSAVGVAVHRLRKRYRTLLREEVGATLSSEDQLDEEMKAIRSALSR